MSAERITIAVTGASGVIYAVRTLRFLLSRGFDIDFIISDAGKINFKVETDWDLDKKPILEFLTSKFGQDTIKGKIREYDVNSPSAPLASGTVPRRGMIIVPCSMKTMAGIANGSASNLIERAADVVLKENYPLIVVPRETPMNVIQLENMLKLARAGARIVPAMPAFYQKPETFDDLADFIVGRVVSLLGMDDHGLFRTWGN